MRNDPFATNSVVVMSFHPLTTEFFARVEAICGPFDGHYDAANLRKMSILAGLRELRRIRPKRLILALEGEAGRSLIGPLSIAALFTRARDITVVWSDLRVQPLRRATALVNIARVMRDTLSSRGALARTKAAGAELEKRPMPRSVPPASGNRILYLDANISLGAPVGGSIGHISGVIGGFLDHGFTVDYASLKSPPTKRTDAHGLKLEAGRLLALPPELNYYRYAELIKRRIARLHRADRWSFLYQRFSLHNFLGPSLGQKLNIPAVVEFNGSEVWAAENWGTRLALHDEAVVTERIALAQADLIVTVSDQLVHELRERGIPDERILVYPNCVDPELFDPARFDWTALQAVRAQYNISTDAVVIGFIGTFGQWHGVDFLACCIHDLVRDDLHWIEKNKIHFMLVGDGPKMAIVRQSLGADPACRYVSLTGLVAQSEAPKLLACADVLVSPHVPNADGSEFFGSPTKLFEYMAMGKPVLASALGQIADVVSGRGATRLGPLPTGVNLACGLLFEPGNAEAFKQGLRRLIEDPPLAASLAQAARAEVLARYTWKQHVNAILERMAELNLLIVPADVDELGSIGYKKMTDEPTPLVTR
jgi:glycosyltransferase involved in cell wall biosynthesis